MSMPQNLQTRPEIVEGYGPGNGMLNYAKKK